MSAVIGINIVQRGRRETHTPHNGGVRDSFLSITTRAPAFIHNAFLEAALLAPKCLIHVDISVHVSLKKNRIGDGGQ